MVGVISILMLLIIFTTVGFVFAWMVHLMAEPPENTLPETIGLPEIESKSI